RKTARSTAKKPARRAQRRQPNASSGAQDALALLRADHDAVLELFDRYEDSDDNAEKSELAQEICQELTIHTTIEEEIFYPEVREAQGDEKTEDSLDEAKVEHDGAKKLIADIEGSDPDDELFDAKIKVLSEYIKHHVKEEYSSIFPAARKSGVDLKEMGERLRMRKEELKSENA
ncbi:MAG TPA: hemerythrin domain-containing protein, partial [Rudaea sp.]